jgi:type II secretory pathway pseudopilin PulG
LLELMVAMGIFLIICAVMFELLSISQKRYNTETQLTAAYQDAMLAMDQVTRDFSVSGYPPRGIYTLAPSPTAYAEGPVAWSPNYPATDCQIGVNCVTPGDYDLIIETRLSGDTQVSWIWYHLDTTHNTLMREVVAKNGSDPLGTAQSSNQAVPLLANVMNNPADAAQLADIKAQYPTMYPTGTAQPIFQYSCNTPNGPQPCTSTQAIGYNTPRNVCDVNITLIVATPRRDIQTQTYKLVELNGRGHRLNPNS